MESEENTFQWNGNKVYQKPHTHSALQHSCPPLETEVVTVLFMNLREEMPLASDVPVSPKKFNPHKNRMGLSAPNLEFFRNENIQMRQRSFPCL